jgi:hypothetical protein
LDALWDLKTLKEQAQYILKKEKKFALGIPNSQKRQLRLANVRSLLAGWQTEFDKLLTDLKGCMSSYNENCTKLANTYEANPKIAQESLLPQKYQSYCYGNIEVRHDSEEVPTDDDRISLQHVGRGDAEMGSGPVRVKAFLDLMVDGTQLKAAVIVSLQEDKADYSLFNATYNFVVFDLNPPDFGDAFKECEFNKVFPVKEDRIVLAGRKAFGVIAARSGRNPPHDKYQTFPVNDREARGALRSISCILDSGGKDDGKLFCKLPELANLHMNLVNKLDLEAEKWQPPGIAGEVPPIRPPRPPRDPRRGPPGGVEIR